MVSPKRFTAMGHAPPAGLARPDGRWRRISAARSASDGRGNADPWLRTNPGGGGLQVVYAPPNQSSSVGQCRGWGIHPVGRGLASRPGRVGCAVSFGTDFTVGTSTVTILDWIARRGACLREFLGGVLPAIHRAPSCGGAIAGRRGSPGFCSVEKAVTRWGKGYMLVLSGSRCRDAVAGAKGVRRWQAESTGCWWSVAGSAGFR